MNVSAQLFLITSRAGAHDSATPTFKSHPTLLSNQNTEQRSVTWQKCRLNNQGHPTPGPTHPEPPPPPQGSRCPEAEVASAFKPSPHRPTLAPLPQDQEGVVWHLFPFLCSTEWSSQALCHQHAWAFHPSPSRAALKCKHSEVLRMCKYTNKDPAVASDVGTVLAPIRSCEKISILQNCLCSSKHDVAACFSHTRSFTITTPLCLGSAPV